jgi:hypothetical protein
MTALDAVGRYEVLARLPEAEVKFVASAPVRRRLIDASYAGVSDETDQLAHRVIAVPGVTKRKLVVDLVGVAASDARLRQVAVSVEVVDDLRRSSFGDPDGRGDVSESGAWIGGDERGNGRLRRPRVCSAPSPA